MLSKDSVTTGLPLLLLSPFFPLSLLNSNEDDVDDDDVDDDDDDVEEDSLLLDADSTIGDTSMRREVSVGGLDAGCCRRGLRHRTRSCFFKEDSFEDEDEDDDDEFVVVLSDANFGLGCEGVR